MELRDLLIKNISKMFPVSTFVLDFQNLVDGIRPGTFAAIVPISPGVTIDNIVNVVVDRALLEGWIGPIVAQLPRNPATTAELDVILAQLRDQPRPTSAVRAIILNRRPFLNREDLWNALQTFKTQQGLDRLLVVTGEAAAGKSYSEYLIAHQAPEGVSFVSLRVPQPIQGELTASMIARSVLDRLWPDSPVNSFNDLSQDARDGKYYGDKLIGRLSRLAGPTWVLIDGFNEVDLAQSALELLIRLCRAVENNELKSLWLILIGIDPASLGSEYEPVIAIDTAIGPEPRHVTEFIRAFAAKCGKDLDASQVAAESETLCGILGSKPSHEAWRSFHQGLAAKCRAIRY